MKSADKPFSLYDMPGHLIRRLHQIAVSIYLEETAASEIRPVQFAAMTAIRAFPGMDQMELSRRIAFDRSTIQDVLIRLEKRGMIRREADPKDRRRRVLHISDKGAKALDDLATDNRRAQSRMLSPLTPEEREIFLKLMTKVVKVNNRFSRAPLKVAQVSDQLAAADE